MLIVVTHHLQHNQLPGAIKPRPGVRHPGGGTGQQNLPHVFVTCTGVRHS